MNFEFEAGELSEMAKKEACMRCAWLAARSALLASSHVACNPPMRMSRDEFCRATGVLVKQILPTLVVKSRPVPFGSVSASIAGCPHFEAVMDDGSFVIAMLADMRDISMRQWSTGSLLRSATYLEFCRANPPFEQEPVRVHWAGVVSRAYSGAYVAIRAQYMPHTIESHLKRALLEVTDPLLPSPMEGCDHCNRFDVRLRLMSEAGWRNPYV